MKEQKNYDEFIELFEQGLEKLKNGKSLSGADGALTPLVKRMLEASLEGELDAHLEKSRPNRRNGHGQKKVKTDSGYVEISTPRDRDASFDPKILPKGQRTLGPSLEKKILHMYSMGMSYQDIASHIVDLYDMELSPSQLSSITDKVWPAIEEWRSRPLENTYPFLWLDAMFYKVKQDGQIKSMAAYMALGMNKEGEKDLLGIYLSETENSRFWLSVLSDLQVRGVKDIFVASIDNLPGFKEAIKSLFPMTDVQLCVVHQIRNSIRYVPWKDQKEVIKDMKQIYKATTLANAEAALNAFESKWSKRYPAMVKSWKINWEYLSSFYNYPPAVRKIMYTTNSIEGFNRQVRKATKNKGSLPSERALYKLLYLVTQHIQKRWSRPQNWTEVIATMAIIFEERWDR